MSGRALPGQSAIAQQGWLKAHKWLLLRRISQVSILGLFLLGPVAGIWIVKGNLSASMTLDILPLTDPLLLVQVILAGHWPELIGLVGALIVAAFYAVVGGRVFCSWVCPVNMLTDAAAWLRRRSDLHGSSRLVRTLRFWMLGLALLLALFTGVIVWEYLNPVSMLHRGIIFGMGLAWVILLAVFLFDLLIARHGWCGHLCPVGAFYGLLGARSLLRVSARQRARCDDCMDCFHVCPEPQVIKPALKGVGQGIGPVIVDASCTNCGRCIDVCAQDVFRFATRLDNKRPLPDAEPGRAARTQAPEDHTSTLKPMS